MKHDGWIKRTLNHRLIQALEAKKWSLLLVTMAFFLGKAMILEKLSPFAIAYFAVVYFVRKDLARHVALAILCGSIFSAGQNTLPIAAELMIFYLIHRTLQKYERSELSIAPFVVLLSTMLVQLFQVLTNTGLSLYTVMLICVESILAFILTLIFIQVLPLFAITRKRYHLKHEEMICLIILVASVMTGMVGWVIGPMSVEHVVSRYLILLVALAGGAPLGASVGVISGLILSLADTGAMYQMSLLAFSGLLAGLLKEGRKIGVALGMLVGSSILSVYIGSQSEVLRSTWETGAAVALFLLTPRSVFHAISKYIPGTAEQLGSEQDYARRVRDATAGRVQQFSEVFRQLSRSFKQFAADGETEQKQEDVGHFMNAIAERACAACWKRKQCWDEKFYRTYKYMTDMMTAVEIDPQLSAKEFPIEWRQACVKTEQVMVLMKQQYETYRYDQHWKKQIYDSRQLVAEQLSGVSQVMEDLAKEIRRESQELVKQEEQIRSALEQLGLSIHSIDIISLDEGNVEIEIVHQYTKGFDECRKIIAPLLSDILRETIVVKNERYTANEDGYYTVSFGSAKQFEIETGVAGAAKGGGLLSGDSFSIVELGNGKFAVAISDGMGNGERARYESSTALSILQQLLQSGMDEKLAIKSVNSVLLLRSSDEMFATVDVALIDMYNAKTTFLKTGSTPSFIKRKGDIVPIKSNNLPIGILQDIDVDLVSAQLGDGDTLIMMTDGIYDAPGPAINKELWMKRMIQEIQADDPQDIADCLLETIVRHHQGEILDDMTVVVAKITKYKPEWTAVRWPGAERFERPRTVS